MSPVAGQIDTHPLLAELAASATAMRTRHAHGMMSWRLWGSGPPIILLHGGHGTWRHWAKNITTLAAGYTVIAADMPGFGDSDIPDVTTMEDYAGIIGAGIDQLALGENMTLVGFSFGCMVGSALPARFWPRIDHFAIVGAPGLGPIHPVITELRSWRRAPVSERNDIHRFNLQQMMLHRPASIDALAVEIQSINTALTRISHRTFLVEGAFQERLERLRPPLSAIWGERDRVVEGLFAPRLALLEAIRPGLRVTLVPDAGHWLPYEEPELVSRHLLEMLQRRDTPGGSNGL